MDDDLRFAVEQAVLAPSSHNTQPWQFRLDGDTVELYADRHRVLHVIDPQDRELVISCGAVPGYALGFGDLGSRLAPLVVRTLDLGRSQAAKSHGWPCSAPLLALVVTDGDGPGDWLRAGRALQRVLLEASAALVATSFLNQPLEIPELRAQVRRIAELAGAPQLLLRLGYAPRTRATPRRPVSEIVIQ